MPAPTPPKMTSLSMMLTSGTMPPRGVKESCHPLIAPQLASVVAVAHNAVLAIPKRTSLPSMLPPDCIDVERWSTPANRGLPFASAQYTVLTPTANSRAIDAQTAQPCFCEPVMRPNVYVRPEDTAKIENSSIKFDSGVGF